LFIGSDQEVRVRQVGRKGGDMKVQHGDVVGIRGAEADEGVLEVVLKPEAFGFGELYFPSPSEAAEIGALS
jgi:hypothetical protein